MAELLEAIKAFVDAIINGISTYVHSDTAFIIDTQLAELVKVTTDEAVKMMRELLDIFGR